MSADPQPVLDQSPLVPSRPAASKRLAEHEESSSALAAAGVPPVSSAAPHLGAKNLQQHARYPVVLRQPAGAPVTAPTAADQRDYVEMVISYLRSAADHYAVLIPVRPTKPGQEPVEGIHVKVDHLGTQLASWLEARNTAANLIDTALGHDQDLTEKLRSGYRDAVRSLIDAAAREGRRANRDAATGPSPRELYQQHLPVIHELAWPRSTADPGGNRLLDAIPAAERTQIRVDDRSFVVPPASLDGYFHPRASAVQLPANTTVVIGPGLTERLRRGLTALVASWANAGQLKVNFTVTMALDLGRYGGDHASYRITYLDRDGARRRELLVERLGSIGLEQRPPSQQAVPQETFKRHGFVRGAGWAYDQFAAVQSAISQVPESMLSAVRGITFDRIAGLHPKRPNRAADYNMTTHTITVFDEAFATKETSVHRYHTPGERQSSDLDRAIAHEIGHAVDRLALRPLWIAFQAAIDEQARFHPRPIPGSRRVHLPPGEIAGWRALQQKIRRLKQALQAGAANRGLGRPRTPRANSRRPINCLLARSTRSARQRRWMVPPGSPSTRTRIGRSTSPSHSRCTSANRTRSPGSGPMSMTTSPGSIPIPPGRRGQPQASPRRNDPNQDPWSAPPVGVMARVSSRVDGGSNPARPWYALGD